MAENLRGKKGEPLLPYSFKKGEGLRRRDAAVRRLFDLVRRRSKPLETLSESVQRLVGALTEREKRILTLIYGLEGGKPRTPEEVAEVIGCSVDEIQEEELRALRKFNPKTNRHPLEPKGPDQDIPKN